MATLPLIFRVSFWALLLLSSPGCLTLKRSNWIPVAFEVAGCGKPLVLLGTIHVSSRPFKVPHHLITRLKQSDLVALELTAEARDKYIEGFHANLQKSNLAVILAQEMATLKNGASLLAKLDPPNAARLEGLLQREKGGVEAFKQLPAGKAMGVALKMLGNQANVLGERKVQHALDFAIEDLAIKHQKNIFSLDDENLLLEENFKKINGQIKTFSDVFSVILQTDRVRAVANLVEVEAAFNTGDIDSLARQRSQTQAATIASTQSSAEGNDLLFARRERIWKNLLLERMQTRSVFAAVGAFHLVGAEGLPESLRAQGCQVERLNSPEGGAPH